MQNRKEKKMEMLAETRSSPKLEIGGSELREMFGAAAIWLEKNEAQLNELNVFPVPDGDTGTNMLLTMKSVVAEAQKTSETTASSVAQAMAKGALMGARGNSGVILSQIMKGFAVGLTGKETAGPSELAEALEQAALAAYASMTKPREGTILTVAKDVALAAMVGIQDEYDIITLMETVVEAARNSVARTPELLDVLRDARVVDAGGQGYYIILAGILNYLRDGEISMEPAEVKTPVFRWQVPVAETSPQDDEEAYGYCTELIIKDSVLRPDQVRRWVESQGRSVLVVGDENTVKIHVHTFHPGMVIEYALSLGTVHDLKIQNMDDQHQYFWQKPATPEKVDDIAIVAVVAGDGLQTVFRSLGAAAVVSGGQTMNPSCADILRAIDSVPSSQVIVLPNNKNIIPAARQAAEATQKTTKVLPTRSIPQGLSALVGFNKEAGLEENLVEMAGNQQRVTSIEITVAVRDARVNNLQIQKGNYIGLIDGELRIASESLGQSVFDALEKADAGNAGIVSLFYGEGVKDQEASELAESIKCEYQRLEIEVIRGSQPHYPYIISVE